ncbi:MAG: FYDLN acid domain-containing protein [Myxococcota bacterium]
MSPAKKTKKKKAATKKSARKKAPPKKATKKTARKSSKPAKKKTAKKAAAKKTAKKPARKAAPKKAAKKAPAKKKEAAKAPSKKAASPKAAAAPKAAAGPSKAPSKRVAPRRKSPPRQPSSPASEILPSRAPITPEAKPAGLGNRWTCYECGSKFYDLRKEEPFCPKCGANQHDAPRVDPRQRVAASDASRTRESRAMAPLLEEDEEVGTPVAAEGGGELDIGLDSVEAAGDDLIEEQEAPAEDEED